MRLRLSEVDFSYPGTGALALDQCSLELDTAAITVLVGNNGAGKSTLIRLLTGQLTGYAGRYTLGEGPSEKEADVLRGELLARHRFGYVPDVPVLDPRLTGLEMILMVGSFRGLSQERTLEQLEPYKEIFDLGDWLAASTCGKYSKGMKKKVSLVLGFLGDLAYSFLDEPFDGLDPIAIYHLKRHLKLRKERGIGALLSSHMLDAAEKVADDLALMKSGRTVYSGNFQTLLDSRPTGTGLEEIYFEYFLK